MSRDYDALNLAGALTDLADLRVPHHPLHRVVRGVAVAAVQLDGLGRGAHRQLGRVQLRHRRLALERLAVLLEPGGVVHQVLRGLDLRGHVREREMHALKARDRAAELLAGPGVAQALLERSLGDPERQRAQADAPTVQRMQELAEAVV